MAHGRTSERMEMLLKQEAGASSVALGKAVARAFASWYVFPSRSFDIVCRDFSYTSSCNLPFEVCRTAFSFLPANTDSSTSALVRPTCVVRVGARPHERVGPQIL